jgi:hypothetical protein
MKFDQGPLGREEDGTWEHTHVCVDIKTRWELISLAHRQIALNKHILQVKQKDCILNGFFQIILLLGLL